MKPKTAADLLRLIEPEAKEMVSVIEAKPETTRNHYAEYLTVLSRTLEEHNRSVTMLWAFAMIKAGANRQGIEAALKLMGVL